jgi:hypothetical protein
MRSDSSRRMTPLPNTFARDGICFPRLYTVKK